jgi:hypothetical protein
MSEPCKCERPGAKATRICAERALKRVIEIIYAADNEGVDPSSAELLCAIPTHLRISRKVSNGSGNSLNRTR